MPPLLCCDSSSDENSDEEISDPIRTTSTSETRPFTTVPPPAQSAPLVTPQLAEVYTDLAPLLDRFGRMLVDIAPHIQRLADSAQNDGVFACPTNIVAGLMCVYSYMY